MKINNISDIKTREYEGYFWNSNADKPEILLAATVDFSNTKERENPFTVEALLYCEEENISVSIRHTGKYQIHEFDLNNYSDENLVDVQYLPHKLDCYLLKKEIGGDIEPIPNSGFACIEKVNFKQLWLPEKDKNCEEMEVLKMKALIFTGFEQKK